MQKQQQKEEPPPFFGMAVTEPQQHALQQSFHQQYYQHQPYQRQIPVEDLLFHKARHQGLSTMQPTTSRSLCSGVSTSSSVAPLQCTLDPHNPPSSMHNLVPSSRNYPSPSALHHQQPSDPRHPLHSSLRHLPPSFLHNPLSSTLRYPLPLTMHHPLPSDLRIPSPSALCHPPPSSLHDPQPSYPRHPHHLSSSLHQHHSQPSDPRYSRPLNQRHRPLSLHYLPPSPMRHPPLSALQHPPPSPLQHPPPSPLQDPPPSPLQHTPPSVLRHTQKSALPIVPLRHSALTEGEAALRPDEERVVLSYSQVPHRVGDLFAHQKRLQLVASEPTGCNGLEQLRPTARFLFDTGLALVQTIYPENEPTGTSKSQTDGLPCVDHLLAPFRFRCRSCSFRGDTELSVLLHYQRGHLSDDGVYSCALDRYGTRDGQAFRQHMGRMHCLVGMPEDKPSAYACSFCFFSAATPAVFYRHLPICTAAAAATGDGSWQLHPTLLVPEPATDLNCCFRLDSLQQFGVSELHGRLIPGTFRGRQIVMPKGSFRQCQATSPALAATAVTPVAGADEKLKAVPHQQARQDQLQIQSIGRPDGLYSSRPAPLGSFTPRVAAPLRICGPVKAAALGHQVPRIVVHCELCNGLCNNASALAAHLAAAHPDALGCCDGNKQKQQQQQLMHRVAASITNGCGAACPDCGRGFVTRYGLEVHRLGGGGVGCPIGRLCAFCQRPFDLAQHCLLGHLVERHPRELRSLISRGVCPVCVASAGATGQLLRHLASGHGLVVSLGPSGTVSLAPRPGVGRAPRDCPACCRCFATDMQLRDHMLTENHSYRCHRCCNGGAAVLLPTKEAWVAHLLREHATERERCAVCQETFQVGLPLTCHLVRSHTRECLVRLKRLSPAEVAAADQPGCRGEPPQKRARHTS